MAFLCQEAAVSIQKVLYFRLIQALPEHIMLAQVQLSRLLGVKKGNNYQAWSNRINCMSADFVVCNKDLSVLLLVAAALSSAATLAAAPQISMTGFGQVRVGLSVPELEKVLGKRIDLPKDVDEVSCRFASPDGLYEKIGFMIRDGHLARLDVDAPGIQTLSGASVGDSQSSVISRYGPALKVTTHAYAGPEGKYLTLYSKDRKYGIRFETDGASVTRYYVGTAEAVQYIEGCQ